MLGYNVGVKVRSPVEKWVYYKMIVENEKELFNKLATIMQDDNTIKLSIEKIVE